MVFGGAHDGTAPHDALKVSTYVSASPVSDNARPEKAWFMIPTHCSPSPQLGFVKLRRRLGADRLPGCGMVSGVSFRSTNTGRVEDPLNTQGVDSIGIGVRTMAESAQQRRSGVPAAQLTDEQRKQLARDVSYVMRTFAYAVDQARRLSEPGSEPSDPEERKLARNVHVEVAVEFARALDDFLAGRGTKADDLFAVHYAPEWRSHAVLTDDLRDTINKQGPHLSTARLDKQEFVLDSIAGDILSAMVKFFEQLPPDRREWFSDAEHRARRARPALRST